MNYNILKEKEPIIILGHNNADYDSIASAYLLQILLNHLNIKNEIVIPDGIIPDTFDIKKYPFNYKTHLNKTDNVLLVDHNSTQYTCNVVGCIDHHSKAESITDTTIEKPQTSCAKIIFDELLLHNIDINKNIYFLTVQSLYYDSLSFNSKKAIEADKKWSNEICALYNFNTKKLYNDGLMLTNLSNINQETVLNEYKMFNINGNNVGTSCAKVKTTPDETMLENIFNEVRYAKDINKADYWMYYLSCIEEEKTIVFLFDNDKIIRTEFDGLKSRSSDLKPLLEQQLPQKIQHINTDEKYR